MASKITEACWNVGEELLRQPEQWSHEEALLMTGSWSGLSMGAWYPSPLGGSDFFRPLRAYMADRHTFGAKVMISAQSAIHVTKEAERQHFEQVEQSAMR